MGCRRLSFEKSAIDRAVFGAFRAYVGVLSIAKFTAAPDPAAYYLEVIANERDDYYLASGEAPGAGSVPGLSGSA